MKDCIYSLPIMVEIVVLLKNIVKHPSNSYEIYRLQQPIVCLFKKASLLDIERLTREGDYDLFRIHPLDVFKNTKAISCGDILWRYSDYVQDNYVKLSFFHTSYLASIKFFPLSDIIAFVFEKG